MHALHDIAPTFQDAMSQVRRCFQEGILYPWWHCEALGQVPGRQTIDRAELLAVIIAIEAALQDSEVCGVDIYIDSQYVIHVQTVLRCIALSDVVHLMANEDLRHRLQPLLSRVKVSFFKVKTHQDVTATADEYLAWQILGNNAVDALCTQTLRRIPSDLPNMMMQCQRWDEREEKDLYKGSVEIYGSQHPTDTGGYS